MRRTERLFRIIQILRSEQRPVTGRALADELEVSLRSLYRDMAELIAQNVPVRGEAGMGYVLDAGYDMPPLMLTPDELEAAYLGAAWVAKRGDPALARGARDLIAKLSAAIPSDLQPVLLDAGLMPIASPARDAECFDFADLRRSVRDQRKAVIAYRNADETRSSRTIWPIFIGYTELHRVVAAWCELRGDFRHFRTDRILTFAATNEAIPERVSGLRQKWTLSDRARRRSSTGEAIALTGAILGHSNPRSTAIYAHIQHEPSRKAANRVSKKIAAALSPGQDEEGSGEPGVGHGCAPAQPAREMPFSL